MYIYQLLVYIYQLFVYIYQLFVYNLIFFSVSRSWQTRSFVQAVRLIVIDEIHLLGEDRGPVLEVIVSRTNFISSHTSNTLRIIGLSTALSNAKDLADWLGIDGQLGLYNFRPSVRPVPLEVHISGMIFSRFHLLIFNKIYVPRVAIFAA